ncbi:SusF/SusE family outer membrane protein [Aquimarina sp. BL5]|uniref:SusE domain-containing protein n=1 Tax=Aquimarina sp. BL5 TaxID=1714860 RepID=UPI000E4A929A|nr:SusE domain-containing protein [Aquimarina sp. BL5]AXT53539.1 SusF/SusE family outer membrane protein [Aquimarina sp. BL5]RKN06411.1 SusF/SusE family outer membrane protein [Aquimarina sp. BL5]
MKKISILLLAFVTVISFNACTDDDQLIFTAQPDPEGVSFVNTFSSQYVLTDETASNLAERFVWESPDFGVDTPVTYELQGSITSTFDDIQVLGSTQENNLPITVSRMIEFANSAGLDNDPETFTTDENGDPVLDADGEPIPNNAGELFVRLRATVGSQGGQEILSDIQPVVVSLPEPVIEEIEFPKLYVVGSFLEASGYGANWTPSENAPAIQARDEEDTQYEGFVFFNDAGANYKFLPSTTSFDGAYGDAGASNGSYSELLLEGGGVDCGLPAGSVAGYYLVKADLTDAANITYSIEPSEWALVGGATPLGWPAGGTEGVPGNDHDMTYDATTQVWTITINLSAGEFKFRANDDWALNLGGDAGNDGSMDFNGPNLSVDADGTYLVTLDLSNPRGYSYSAELQ